MHTFDTKRGEPVRMLLERCGQHAVTAHVQHVRYESHAMVAVELRDCDQRRLGGVDCPDLPPGYVEALLHRYFAEVGRSDDQSDETHAAYAVAEFRVPQAASQPAAEA